MKSVTNPNRKKGWGQVQIGTSSLVLIFTVLSLVVFSTLSLTSAKVDQTLAEKTRQYVMDYYAGDSLAEENLKETDEKLQELAENTTTQMDYAASVADEFQGAYEVVGQKLNFLHELNEDQYLQVTLELIDHEEALGNGKNYKVTAWLVKNKVDYEIDDSMPVWNGDTI